MELEKIYLSFLIISKRINTYIKSNILHINVINNNDLKISNNASVLSFKLNTYNEKTLIFQIVLEFINFFGGVY